MTIGIDTTFLVQHDVQGTAFHEWARHYLEASIRPEGHTPGLCPQVICEYLRVITDPQRFEHPLGMDEAIVRAAAWWSLPGMHAVFPSQRTVALFSEWMGMHDPGSKRILDTMLAATYASNGYHGVLTTDRKCFARFDGITVLAPPEAEGTARSRA